MSRRWRFGLLFVVVLVVNFSVFQLVSSVDAFSFFLSYLLILSESILYLSSIDSRVSDHVRLYSVQFSKYRTHSLMSFVDPGNILLYAYLQSDSLYSIALSFAWTCKCTWWLVSRCSIPRHLLHLRFSISSCDAGAVVSFYVVCQIILRSASLKFIHVHNKIPVCNQRCFDER